MSRPVTVLVVDDQTLVRQSLTGLLALVDGITVVGAAADGAEAVNLTGQLDPDVVLMDLVMPHVDGLTATRCITRDFPRSQVLALTTYDDETSVGAALRAGAVGYLTKDTSAENLARAIHLTRAGATALDAHARRSLVPPLDTTDPGRTPGHDLDHAPGDPATETPNPDNLTTREAEVLRAMAEGLTNTEIATRLHLGTSTVKTHINNLFAKAGLTHRGQAVAYAYRKGLAGPGRASGDERMP